MCSSHHDEVHLLHLSSYSEAYTRALRMDSAGFFRDQATRQRLRLGLGMHADKRQAALERLEKKRRGEGGGGVGEAGRGEAGWKPAPRGARRPLGEPLQSAYNAG